MCCIYKALKKFWTLSIIISQESVKASTVVSKQLSEELETLPEFLGWRERNSCVALGSGWL